jgi:hypothetical protein
MTSTPDILEIRFDEQGDIDPAGEQALNTALDSAGASDLIMFSHGWNNTPSIAMRLYEAFFARLATLVTAHGDPDRKVVYLGVFWPSTRWSDEPIPDFEPQAVADLGTRSGGGAAGFSPPKKFDPPPPPDAELKSLIRESFPSDVRGDVDELLTLLDERPDDEASLQKARDLVRKIAEGAGQDGDGEQSERPPFAAQPDPNADLFTDFTNALHDLNVVTAPQGGGAASLGDRTRRLWHGAQEVLRTLTYWQMKNRAGVVGERGLGPLIGRLKAARPQLRINLIGHSFGARVVSYALKGAPATTPPPVQSVTLLQGAFSHFAFAASLPFDAVRSGALNGQQSKVAGAVTACYSVFDSAVGTMYPLASLLKREDAAAADDVTYRWGGIGHDGHQKGVPALPLQAPGEPYEFGGNELVNIDAQNVVRKGTPPSGAHSDIVHDELAWVVVWASGLAH